MMFSDEVRLREKMPPGRVILLASRKNSTV